MPNLFANHPTHAECETEIKALKARLTTPLTPVVHRGLTEDLEFFEELVAEIEVEALAAEHGVST